MKLAHLAADRKWLATFRPVWQFPVSRHIDQQPPHDETIAALQRLRDEIRARVATKSREALTLQLLSLIDEFGYDQVALRVRNIGESMQPSPGTSKDPRR